MVDSEIKEVDTKELTDFAKLKFVNNFAGYPLETIALGTEVSKIAGRELGTIMIYVQTVGTDYPVAYHVELLMQNFYGGSGGYRNSTLGYASATKLKEDRILKDAIAGLMERAATTLLKIQDKL